jgi:hypothetical protein
LTDCSGLVPYATAWWEYWLAILDKLIAGEQLSVARPANISLTGHWPFTYNGLAERKADRSMKLVMLGIALIACLPVSPQDQLTVIPQNYQVFRISGGFRVVAEDGRFVNAIAATIESAKALRVVRFKGNVEITINGVELRADEVDYHWDTGELEPNGNVHVKPIAK